MSRLHRTTQHHSPQQLRSQNVAVSSSRIQHAWGVIDTRRMRIFFIAGIIALGVLYLFLVNSTAASGFYLSDLEDQMQDLDTQYRKLEIVQNELGSLEHMQARGQEMQMVISEGIQFTSLDNSVAFGKEPIE